MAESGATPGGVDLLKEKGIDDAKLPVVMFGDGTALVQPSSTELANKVGLRTQAQQKFYDVVVVGAGPAGWLPASTELPKACGR